MSVAVRTSLATEKVRWNNLFSSRPSVPASCAFSAACFIWPRIWVSPSTIESSPEATRDYLRLEIGERHNELFGVLFMDNRHRIIAKEELFYGTIDGASVHPRVVVARALTLNAAAVMFYHNHPSGVAEPSQSDLRITSRLKDALSLVDVRVLDHFIVSAEDSISFAERGLI